MVLGHPALRCAETEGGGKRQEAHINLFAEIESEGALPYVGMSNQKVWVNVSDGYRLPQLASTSGRVIFEMMFLSPASSLALLDAKYKLMLACWQATTGDRITFQTVVSKLQTSILEPLNAPVVHYDCVTLGLSGMEDIAESPSPLRTYVPLAEQIPTNLYMYEPVDARATSSNATCESESSFQGDSDAYLPLQGLQATLYAEDEFLPAASRTATLDLSSGPQPAPPFNGRPGLPTLKDVGYVDVVEDNCPSLVNSSAYCNGQLLLQAGIEDQLGGVTARVNPLYSASRASSMADALSRMTDL